ncbi:histidine triad family protein [Deferribacter desulfuricans SSM1]|uniref:Histidine triad family protein n=1 Tax=Deferribacter desulfuricans (strain DSM 14783 / JCM 11476 / NBRC 101012 / SSM1) TaxID=639282 RepID=D3P9G8_DEFDS|nr:histidine triad family protein [Deferribacter desulfuricans SSM1]
MDCIFCKIISGEIPSAKVYEDDDFIAILDIRPVHLGHTLLIPKKHFRNIYDTDKEIGEKIYPVLVKLANAIKSALNCDGLNIVQNNEPAGGQEVFHSHIHLIPRYENDGIRFAIKHKQYESNEQMAEFAKKIANKLK